jgi:pyridoxal phosphate enzyme (YggS family)
MIANNIASVRDRVKLAVSKSHRNVDSVRILAVSKTKPTDDIIAAYQCGMRDFGENYVQELEAKVNDLSAYDICWHFIGPLQSNKTGIVAKLADWVHSVDRLKIARRLNEQRPAHMQRLNVCIQVNIDNEATKSGATIEEAVSLAKEFAQLDRLLLRGIMVIPTASAAHDQTFASFERATQILETLKSLPECKGAPLDTLSMGMSGDLDLAIAAGSTMVRIGSDIFGARN